MIDVKIIRENRKSMALFPRATLLLVKAPLFANDQEIYKFIAKHEQWVKDQCIEEPFKILGKPIDWHTISSAPMSFAEKKKKHRQMCHELTHRLYRKTLTTAKIHPPPMRICTLASAWGKCHNAQRIELHWKIATLPKHLAEYVIFHEIAHFQYMDHSKNFWAHLDSLCTGARKLDRELGKWR
jgi:predicted metal-dependent hydrolase